jgi:hypothetical protein
MAFVPEGQGDRSQARSACTCLAPCPSRPRRRPSSLSVFRVTQANLPPLAFPIHSLPSWQTRLKPPTEDEDENEDEDD